jgi:hypothetical protein
MPPVDVGFCYTTAPGSIKAFYVVGETLLRQVLGASLQECFDLKRKKEAR